MDRSGSVVLNQLMRAIPKRGRASGESSVVAERFRKLHFEKFLELLTIHAARFLCQLFGICSKICYAGKIGA